MKSRNILLFATLLLAAQLGAQPLVLEWQGPPNSEPASGFNIGMPPPLLDARLDANGDGVDDLAIFDKMMKPVKLTVINGTDHSEKWDYPLPDQFAEVEVIGPHLLGFFEMASDGGLKEAVMTNREGTRLIGVLEGGKVKIESGVVLFGNQYVFLGIADYDDDGNYEMLLGDLSGRVVEMWGPGD